MPSVQRSQGTQTLARGIRILRAIAARPQFGWRLSDLCLACGMDKATVHRMLARLIEERLVRQSPTDRRYLPGPLLHELGLAVQDRVGFDREAEPVLRAFADRMGGIALLQWRSGSDYVCSVRAGSASLSALLIVRGTRRPLFSSVGGLAILQHLAPLEREVVLQRNLKDELARYGEARLDALRRMRERSDQHGFGVNLGDVVPGLHAFALPLFGPQGEVVAAVSLMGEAAVLPSSQLAVHRRQLASAVDELQGLASRFSM